MNNNPLKDPRWGHNALVLGAACLLDWSTLGAVKRIDPTLIVPAYNVTLVEKSLAQKAPPLDESIADNTPAPHCEPLAPWAPERRTQALIRETNHPSWVGSMLMAIKKQALGSEFLKKHRNHLETIRLDIRSGIACPVQEILHRMDEHAHRASTYFNDCKNAHSALVGLALETKVRPFGEEMPQYDSVPIYHSLFEQEENEKIRAYSGTKIHWKLMDKIYRSSERSQKIADFGDDLLRAVEIFQQTYDPSEAARVDHKKSLVPKEGP